MENLEELKKENEQLHNVIEEQAWMLDESETNLRMNCLSLAVQYVTNDSLGHSPLEVAKEFYSFVNGKIED